MKIDEVDHILELAKVKHSLPIVGLMCLPPLHDPPSNHFKILYEIAKKHELPRVSMGMSNDFVDAIKFGATDVRIGSAIFGTRV